MRLFIQIAWRNIWRNKKRSLITITSIMLALLFTIFVRSLQIGLYTKLLDNVITAYSGYMQIHGADYWEEKSLDNSFHEEDSLFQVINSIEGITGSAPRLESFALCIGDDNSKGVMIIGSDIEKEKQNFGLDEKLIKGAWSDGSFVIYPTSGIASHLKLDVEDTVVLLSQGYRGSSAADKFVIKGIIEFKNPHLNDKIMMMPLKSAQLFYGAEGQLTSVAILSGKKEILASLDDIVSNRSIQTDERDIDGQLLARIGPEYDLKRWDEMMPELVQIIIADNAGGILMNAILYMVVFFGVFGTILMLTAERKYEFGVLIAIGMKRTKLMLVVLLETIIMAFIGVLSGCILVTPFVIYFQINPIRLTGQALETVSKYGFEPLIPTILDPSIYFTHAMIVLVFTILISFYPLWYIYKLKAVKAMRDQ